MFVRVEARIHEEKTAEVCGLWCCQGQYIRAMLAKVNEIYSAAQRIHDDAILRVVRSVSSQKPWVFSLAMPIIEDILFYDVSAEQVDASDTTSRISVDLESYFTSGLKGKLAQEQHLPKCLVLAAVSAHI